MADEQSSGRDNAEPKIVEDRNSAGGKADPTTLFQLICEGWNAFKLFGFFVGLFLALFGLTLWLLPCLLTQIAAVSSGDVSISIGNASLAIELKSAGVKTITRVINVPAHRVLVPTDLELKEGDEVTITATGLVSTLDLSGVHEHLPYDINRLVKAKLLGPYQERIEEKNDPIDKLLWDELKHDSMSIDQVLATELAKELVAREYRMSWRDPEGEYVFQVARVVDKPLKKGVDHDFAVDHKMCPKAEFGSLVAYFGPADERGTGNCHANFPPRENFGQEDRKKRTRKIGENTLIEYKDGIIKVASDPTPLDVKLFKSKTVTLYLGVNDSVLDKDSLEQFISKKEEVTPKDPRIAIYEFQQKLCELADSEERGKGRKSGPSFVNSLWYSDNRGSFTVIIEQKRKLSRFCR
ncbi:hypothetical protein ACFL2Q_12025 [Thermodesulfobacteriota bacterium]